ETATGAEIALIIGERFGHGDGTAALDGAACERPRLVLRLPEREHALAVRVLEVVGDAGQVLEPVAPTAVAGTQNPRVAILAAPIAERDAGRDGGEAVRLALHRELEPVGAGFELR